MTLTVLQVIPNMGAGGAEQACVDITLGLKERGDRAIVVSSGGSRVSEIIQAGGEHFVHDVASKNPAAILLNAVWLAKFIKAHKVDIVHVRSRAPAWSCWLATKWQKKLLISTFHAAYKFSNPVKKFYNSVMTYSDRIIAISDFIEGHIKRSYKGNSKKIKVIYRGIDLKRFDPDTLSDSRKDILRSNWSLTPGQRLLLAPARLSPIKGQELLIQAMALLPPACSDVMAVILGDDQGRSGYRQKLQEMAHNLKLSSRVRLMEHCNDMPAAYAISDLVVVPSLVAEGFGRVPVEAMAMGVPVIASDLGATQETIIDGKTGWLLPPKSPAQWAEQIAKSFCLSDVKKAQMKDISIKRARKLFDREQMVQQTLALYDEVSGKPGNG